MIENSWFYYFSSLAQTIASGSTLLIALAIIKLQNLDTYLLMIERSISEIFYNIEEMDKYREHTYLYFTLEDWDKYFYNVKVFADQIDSKFSTTQNYICSKEYLQSLIEQGNILLLKNKQLHRLLIFAFIGTVILAGLSIIVLPLARWISHDILMYSWIISAAILLCLFIIYIILITKALNIRFIRHKKNDK